MSKPKTIFCDLDGTLVKHPGDVSVLTSPEYKLEVLPGVKDFLKRIDSNRYCLKNLLKKINCSVKDYNKKKDNEKLIKNF